MVPSQTRQKEILSLLSPSGRVGVGMLADHFQVTSETIRRDLRTLESVGLVQRVHGGAILPESDHSREPAREFHKPVLVPGYPPTSALSSLAQTAARLIKPDTRSIFLDAGLPGIALATVLGGSFDEGNWTVVTTSVGAGVVLARAGMPRIAMVGGSFSPQSQSLTGAAAVSMLASLRAEIAFICPDGIVDHQSLLSIDPEAGATRRAMLTHSRFNVLLCPSACLKQHRGSVFGDISEFDALVTDADIHDSALMFLSDRNIQVVTP